MSPGNAAIFESWHPLDSFYCVARPHSIYSFVEGQWVVSTVVVIYVNKYYYEQSRTHFMWTDVFFFLYIP